MRRRKGFALLMTLFLLAISMTIVVGLARHSLSSAWRAQHCQAELQRKWGALSLQRSLHMAARQLLDSRGPANRDRIGEPGMLAVRIRLGEWDFHCHLQDESCKCDLNQILKVCGANSCRKAASLLSDEVVNEGIEVAISTDGDGQAGRNLLEAWSQVFPQHDSLARLYQYPGGAASSLTLWAGPLNYHQASDEVLDGMLTAACGKIVADRVVRFRRQLPDAALGDMVRAASTNPTNLRYLQGLLSSGSNAYSSTITASNGVASSGWFLVERSYGGGLVRTFSQSW